jgi:hypothetical protein
MSEDDTKPKVMPKSKGRPKDSETDWNGLRAKSKQDLARIKRRTIAILNRDTIKLRDKVYDTSTTGGLHSRDRDSLVSYMKLLNYLEKQEAAELESLSDEELAKIASKDSEKE